LSESDKLLKVMLLVTRECVVFI